MGGGPNGLMGIAASLAAGKGNLLVLSPFIGTVLPGSVMGSVKNLVEGRAIHGKKPLVPGESSIMCPRKVFLCNKFVPAIRILSKTKQFALDVLCNCK